MIPALAEAFVRIPGCERTGYEVRPVLFGRCFQVAQVLTDCSWRLSFLKLLSLSIGLLTASIRLEGFEKN